MTDSTSKLGLVLLVLAASGHQPAPRLSAPRVSQPPYASFHTDPSATAVERPHDLRTWIEGQLYNPQYQAA